jgi:transcriptional regulator with XRE-family HTH domain
MSRRVPVQDVFKEWEKDPVFRAEYDSLEEEFTLATALIKARDAAQMTQEQVARAMGTSQEAVARLESGRSLPSTRTLQRFAKATGMRLRISFEPQPAALAGEGERPKAERLLAYGRRLRQITAEGSSDTGDLYDARGLPE